MTKTCARARALIETASFMAWPREDLDAAKRHARACEACRSTLDSQVTLESDLRMLSSPIDAPDLATAVMTHIAAVDISVSDAQQEPVGEAGWWWRAASALAVAVAIALWGPVWFGPWIAHVQASMRLGGWSHGGLPPVFALVSALLYVFVLFKTSRWRQAA